MKTLAVGVSHAKIILIGEHSVVYGQPAIALPLPSVKTTVVISPSHDQVTLSSRYFDGPLRAMGENLAGLRTLIRATLKQLHQEEALIHFEITSDLPAERGMGSSAAVAIATIRALYSYFEQSLTRDRLLDLAAVEENVTHGNPSGIDAATTSSNAPISFIHGQSGQEIPFNMSASLVIADSGIKGQTGVAVQRVADERLLNQTMVDEQLNRLGQLADQAKQTLANNDPVALGRIMTKAHAALRQLKVSTPVIDHLTQVALENGALGAKMTGGGLGGCVIALAPNRQTADQLAERLTFAGATATWIQDFDKELIE